MPAQRRKTSADGSTPKRAVAAPPPRTGRGDCPRQASICWTTRRPPHGQRRCQATHCSTSSRTPPPARAETIGGQELQADEIRGARAYAEATTGSRCDAIQTGFHAQRAWLCLFKIEAARSLYPRKRAGFEEPGTSGALATRGRRIDLARAICGNFSQSSFTLLSK